MSSEAVDFDGDPLPLPEEVDLPAEDLDVHLRRRELGLADEAQHAPLEAAAGAAGIGGEDTPQLRRAPAPPSQGGLDLRGRRSVQPKRRGGRGLQLLLRFGCGEVEERSHGGGDRNPLESCRVVPVESCHTV